MLVKKFLFLTLAVAALVALNITGAYALSTEQSPVTSSGAPKFADPDEQSPLSLGMQAGQVSNNVSVSSGPLMVAPGALNAVGMQQGGADAFDHAYDHQQIK